MPGVVPWLFSLACTGAVLGIRTSAVLAMSHGAWVRVIACAWLGAALANAAIGLVQYFGSSAELAPWVNGTGLGEAYGNLRQRNQFATLTVIGMAPLVWWVLQGASWTLASGAAVLLALGNAASSSRTGLLQWMVLLALFLYWGGARHLGLRRVLVVAVVAYIGGMLALPWGAGLDPLTSGAWARLHQNDAACSGRLTLWSNVLHLIAQRPWAGWGWGELDYAHFITLYPAERFCDILDNAHNLPLQLAVELGLPIALLVCGASVWMVLRARPWCEKCPTRQLAWAVLAAVGLHSLLEYPLWYGPFQMAVGLCVWLLWRTPRLADGPTQNFESFRPMALVYSALAATILIAFSTYSAWDYWRVSQLYLASTERASAYRDNTLEKLQGTWLFKNQVQFAELTTIELTSRNAERGYSLAQQLLHFSPEPRVAEKLIESATLLGRNDEAVYYLARYRAAFPEAHARWAGPLVSDKTP